MPEAADPGGRGPLDGVRIIELAGIGPVPFGCMMLADLGADVLRIDRVERARGAPDPIPERPGPRLDLLNRGRQSLALDLKQPDGREVLMGLVDEADALVEGYRPGVVDRLEIGPRECLERNPRLLYVHTTGWGQDGPLAGSASHDINSIALSGVLHAVGRAGQPPTPPLALAGDFGGGGMLLAIGLLAGLVEARSSGEGQEIDVSMIDGSSLLMTHTHGLYQAGLLNLERGTNRLDSGTPFYDSYETADGKFMAIGAIESHFFQTLLALLGLDPEEIGEQMDRSGWPAMREKFEATFRSKTQAEWCRLLENTDACASPVLSVAEVGDHPHHQARRTFTEVNGVPQPAPAPRFSRTQGTIRRPPPEPGEHSREALAAWGFASEEVDRLLEAGVIAERASTDRTDRSDAR